MNAHLSEVLGLIRRNRPVADAAFNQLAILTYLHQRQTNPVYDRYCRTLNVKDVRRWQEIPALPVSAFKYHRVAAFPKKKTIRIFMTSGTTRGALRGKHAYETLTAYDATVRTLFHDYVLPDFSSRQRIPIVFMVAPSRQKPESSLSYMGSRVQREFGEAQPFYALDANGVRSEALTRHLQKAAQDKKPILIYTTTFALADYLDFLAAQKIRLALPRGSRILETGGFKGRRTVVSRPVLVRCAAERLGIPATHVVNEYGMTELTSQFYDVSLRSGRASSVKGIAPWMRVLIVDAATGRPVVKGRRGLIRIYDLANQGSCLAIQTEDEGRLVGGGFQILGRQKGADLRGCSLSFEALKGLA